MPRLLSALDVGVIGAKVEASCENLTVAVSCERKFPHKERVSGGAAQHATVKDSLQVDLVVTFAAEQSSGLDLNREACGRMCQSISQVPNQPTSDNWELGIESFSFSYFLMLFL
ncbi:unnamed protein product [Gadus morhua 'NCC']